jgi:hypothetical protein
MSEYIPDKWVVVKITGYKDSPPVHKVFACWYGGWSGSDSWKLNSGITKATLEGFVYSFEGSSGSVYLCHEDTYGTNMYGNGVLGNMIVNAEKNGVTVEILPEDTNWLELNYE